MKSEVDYLTTKRNHHYVPKSHLSGFTKHGNVESSLWVFDQLTAKQWESKPVRVAFQKDLYAISFPEIKPDAIEDIFADLENKVAPIIRWICENLQMPNGEEYIWLMNYIALLAERTPTRREVFAKPMEDMSKLLLKMSLSTPESYEALRQAMILEGEDVSDLSYEELHQFAFEEKYSISFDNNTHVQHLLIAMDTIIPTLVDREWTVIYCAPELGDFICSDNPVCLQWTKEKDRGFWSSPGYGLRETEVSIPLSSRVILLGKFEKSHSASGRIPSRKSLAIFNSRTGMYSHRYIFSRKKNFFWYTNEGRIGDIDDFKKR
jgi:hypothetical protein